MATYTAVHKHNKGKVHGISEEQKAEMERLKIAQNFTFSEESNPEKPAVEKPSTGTATANKTSKGDK